MDAFLVFVVVVIAWIVLGLWGASLLTRKGYLKPESLSASPRSTYAQRLPTSGVSIQYLLAFLGPVTLIAGWLLPKKSTT